jgi:hypothetical protein
MTIAEANSFGFDVRDTFYNVVTADASFSGYTFRKTRMLPVQRDLIPYLGIYIIDETMLPDGDANAGCIRFSHTVRIGFSVVLGNNDQVGLEKSLDAAYLRIMTLLYTSPVVMNVLTSANVEGVNIESITRGVRRHVFGSVGANNEYPFGELQYDVSVFYRTEWYPDITDMLDEIDVTVSLNNADTSTVQPVDIKYMLNQLREHAIVTKERK